MAKTARKDVATTQRGPQSALPRLDSEIERLLEPRWPGFFNWPRLSELRHYESPSMDIVDQESDIIVRAEVPGFKKEDIELSVTDNAVTVKATAENKTEKEEDGDYYLKEISRGYVSRTVMLPSEVDAEQASAKYTDGVLEVTIPKIAKAKRQRIEIQAE